MNAQRTNFKWISHHFKCHLHKTAAKLRTDSNNVLQIASQILRPTRSSSLFKTNDQYFFKRNLNTLGVGRDLREVRKPASEGKGS